VIINILSCATKDFTAPLADEPNSPGVSHTNPPSWRAGELRTTMVLSYLGTCGVSIPLRAEARTRVGRPDCGRWRHGQGHRGQSRHYRQDKS
jgi:hypothetical protein